LGKKWWVLSHGDGDGVASAAVASAVLGDDVKGIYFTHPAGLAEDLRVVERGDSVMIMDIALSAGMVEKVIEELGRIAREGGSVVYIDHHPIPPGFDPREIPGSFVHSECCCASELTFSYLQKTFSGSGLKSRELEKIALYGAISDYLDDTEWAKRALENWDKRYIYYEAGVLSQGLEGMRRQHDLKREIVRALAAGEDPSSISELVVNSIFMSRNEKALIEYVSSHYKVVGEVAYVQDPPGSVPRAATYAKAASGKKVGAAFEIRKGMASMSLRASDASLRLNEIAMRLAPKFGGNAGGHPQACGARIPVEKVNEFFEAVSEALRSELVGAGEGKR